MKTLRVYLVSVTRSQNNYLKEGQVLHMNCLMKGLHPENGVMEVSRHSEKEG